MSLRRGDALLVVGLLAFLGLLSATAPRWARMFLPPPPGTAAPGARQPRGSAAQASPASAEAGRISVQLFFESEEIPALVQEERAVPLSTDLSNQIRLVVEELIKGSSSGHDAPLPPETKVLAVFVTARGVAYLDLSGDALAAQPGGSAGERLSVWALVNTVAVNFPAIKKVQILIDDHPAETLAGHIDLSQPLAPDLTLVAAAPAAEAAPPEPAAGPSPSPSA